jgi:hypothetical protein
MKRRFVFGKDNKLYPEDDFPESVERLHQRPPVYGRGPAIFGDFDSFISPIDGKEVRGRKALRQHCKDHNVVPTRDLQGLPAKPSMQEYKPDKAAIREDLKRQLYK